MGMTRPDCSGRPRPGLSSRVSVTYGLDEFIKPALVVFQARAGHRFAHLREMHLCNQFNHNSVRERLNGGIGNRIKVARGFNSDRPAPVRLMIVYHNLFRGHEGTGGKTHAQAAGIEMEGKDKWEIVIADAAPACARRRILAGNSSTPRAVARGRQTIRGAGSLMFGTLCQRVPVGQKLPKSAVLLLRAGSSPVRQSTASAQELFSKQHKYK